MVLAVQSELIIDTPTKGKPASARSRSGGVQVTLQVDFDQALALQVAITQGSVALFCRSPSDKKETSSDSITLEEGRLITLTAVDLKTAVTSEEGEQSSVVSKSGGNPNETGNAVTAVVPIVPVGPVVVVPPKPRKPRRRKVIVHHGKKIEEKEFQESTTGGDSSKATPFGHERRFNEVGRTVNEIAR
jgi:hypothetical protein